MSFKEVSTVLQRLEGVHGLLAHQLYRTGLRIEEALQLRVKDLGFANQAIFVGSGKGDKDRVVMLPRPLEPALRQHVAQASRSLWSTEVPA
jgi:site-specific recombinase XerD